MQEGKKNEKGRGPVAVKGHLKVLLLSGRVPNSSSNLLLRGMRIL